MILLNDSNDSIIPIMFLLTLGTIREYWAGNGVSEFTHSNCITLSYYPSTIHKRLNPIYSTLLSLLYTVI